MDNINPIWKLNRIADDNIYLNEDRYNKPKISFKKLYELIKKRENCSFLDVGCATGELIYFLIPKLPSFSFQGLDISNNLLDRARAKITNTKFIQQDIVTPYSEWSEKPTADIVVMFGVLAAFDNFEDIMENLFSCANKGGIIYVMMNYTSEPIDAVMRYRRSGSNTWESGWNTVSKQTMQLF